MKGEEKNGFEWKESITPNWPKLCLLILLTILTIVTYRFFPPGGTCNDICGHEFSYFDIPVNLLRSVSRAFWIMPALNLLRDISETGNMLGISLGALLLLSLVVVQLVFLYLISCLAFVTTDGKTKLTFLLGILILWAVFSIIWYSIFGGAAVSCHCPLPQCKAQIAMNPVCIDSTGNWNPNGCGESGCSFAETGVSSICSHILKGTGYYMDETHFNCGPRPA